jgi:hypothetical protein
VSRKRVDAAFRASGSAEEAREAGAIFYALPADLAPEMIDPLLRNAVGRINASGWVWTAESCQGHPDAATATDTGWLHNTDPFLRLVCRQEREGEMLALLMRACTVGEDDFDHGIYHGTTARLFREQRGDYAELLVYLPSRNVMDRDQGVRVFERFASAVNQAEVEL